MDFPELFQRFWWLIFPILSMVWGMVDQLARHRRAREGMHLIKSYIDQGKEPPPELLKFMDVKCESRSLRDKSGWTGVFLFAALSAGFLWATFLPDMDFEPKQIWALQLVAMVFGALCLGCLVNVLGQDRNRQ